MTKVTVTDATDIKLENWTIFATHVVSIEVHQLSKKEYQGAMTFILDDGEPLSDEPENHRGMTILLDHVGSSPEAVIQHVAPLVGQMFERISVVCMEFDKEGELSKQHDLGKVMKKLQKQRKHNVVFAN